MVMTEQLEKIALEAEQTQVVRDWEEDFKHENGNYFNICHGCGNQFIGHKRRIICKACAKPDRNAQVEQASVGHEDTERLNYLLKSGQIVIEVNGEYFTYNHTSGRSGPAKETPRAAIDASMDEKGGA